MYDSAAPVIFCPAELKETTPCADRDASRRDVRPYTARGCLPFSQSRRASVSLNTRARSRAGDAAGHTFVFGLSGGRVIDGSRGGNSTRFLNHACEPNCEAIEVDDRVFIHAVTAINPGEELFIDYGLAIDGEITDDVRSQYACYCGPSACRRSMIGDSATST